MERNFKRIRIVVVQPDEQVYFDRYYTDPLVAMDKFNYFCKLAKINYPQEVEFAMERTALYNEMTAYFPYNEINPSNQIRFCSSLDVFWGRSFTSRRFIAVLHYFSSDSHIM